MALHPILLLGLFIIYYLFIYLGPFIIYLFLVLVLLTMETFSELLLNEKSSHSIRNSNYFSQS